MDKLYKINIMDDDDDDNDFSERNIDINAKVRGYNETYDKYNPSKRPKIFISNLVIPYKRKFYEWVKEHPITPQEDIHLTQNRNQLYRNNQVSSINIESSNGKANKAKTENKNRNKEITIKAEYSTMNTYKALIKESTVVPSVDEAISMLKKASDENFNKELTLWRTNLEKYKNNEIKTLPEYPTKGVKPRDIDAMLNIKCTNLPDAGGLVKYTYSDQQKKSIETLAIERRKLEILEAVMKDENNILGSKIYNGQRLATSGTTEQEIQERTANKEEIIKAKEAHTLNPLAEEVETNKDKATQAQSDFDKAKTSLESTPDYVQYQAEIKAYEDNIRQLTEQLNNLKKKKDIKAAKNSINEQQTQIQNRQNEFYGADKEYTEKLNELNNQREKLKVAQENYVKTKEKAEKKSAVETAKVNKDQSLNRVDLSNANKDKTNLLHRINEHYRKGSYDADFVTAIALQKAHIESLEKDLRATIKRELYNGKHYEKLDKGILKDMLNIHRALRPLDNNNITLENAQKLYDAINNSSIMDEKVKDEHFLKMLHFGIDWWEKTANHNLHETEGE